MGSRTIAPPEKLPPSHSSNPNPKPNRGGGNLPWWQLAGHLLHDYCGLVHGEFLKEIG